MPHDDTLTPASPSRRSVLCALGSGLLAGCAQTPTMKLASDTFKFAFAPSAPYPRSRAEVDALPYAQLGIRLGKGGRGIMVLAEKNGDELNWVSSDRKLVATRGQRIIRTVGLGNDLRACRMIDPDLWERYDLTAGSIDGLSVSYLLDLSPGELYQIPARSRFKVEGDETIDILGQPVDTLRVREEISSETLRWRETSYHWISKRSSLAWRSRHAVYGGGPPIELEMLKRPG